MILFFLFTTYFKDFECSVKSRKFGNVSRCFDFITSSRSNATKEQTKLEQQIWTKAPERRVCTIYSLSFILVECCFTYKLDRSKFWTNSLFPVFTQAFHKISIQTSMNNTENMPQVTRSNNSAISIDNDASDLWLLVNCVLFLFKKTNVAFLPILVKWQISVKSDVHNTSLLIKYEIAQIFYDWFDNLKDVFQRICEN